MSIIDRGKVKYTFNSSVVILKQSGELSDTWTLLQLSFNCKISILVPCDEFLPVSKNFRHNSLYFVKIICRVGKTWL